MSYWQDKVALVTGGSAGLGLAIAEAFVARGAKVVVAARGAERLTAAAEKLSAAGGQAVAIPVDITRQDQVDALFDRTLERFGRLDVLVNNAGRSSRGEALATAPEDFCELLDINLIALVRCTRAAVPHLLKSKGHVVNIGSLSSKSASCYLAAYPTSKFAMAGYSQQLRLELAPRGVHVLLVCPGPIAGEERLDRFSQKVQGLPESAFKHGAGVKLKAIPPQLVARRVVSACERRKAEIVIPAKARLLFALSQLWPELGDRIIRRMT